MDQLTFTLLLDYLYSKFAVTFILSIVGIVIRLVIKNVGTKQKVSIGRFIASAVFSTILLCALRNYVDIDFSVYVFLCIVVGMWSPNLVSVVLDSKFMGNLLKKYLKGISEPVAKSLSDALEEENKKDTNDDTKAIEDKKPPDTKNTG